VVRLWDVVEGMETRCIQTLTAHAMLSYGCDGCLSTWLMLPLHGAQPTGTPIRCTLGAGLRRCRVHQMPNTSCATNAQELEPLHCAMPCICAASHVLRCDELCRVHKPEWPTQVHACCGHAVQLPCIES
jgi:hypothetical protein